MKGRAAAIVLAAGLGTRFGESPKLVAMLDGKPILQHVLDTLRAAGIQPVVVILGHAIEDVRSAIEWREEIQVVNRHPERGILRSVLLGLRQLSQTWLLPDRTLIVLGDQPRLKVEQIAALLAEPVDEERPFVIPRYVGGESANPVLLEADGRFQIEQLLRNARPRADRGLSQFFAALPDRVRAVDVPGANPDIDSPEDLQRLIVAHGYDALGNAYREWCGRVRDPARDPFVADLVDRLEAGARVLDVGCGPGVPSTKQLAERFAVIGLDVSEAQLELARQNVPGATFVRGDVVTAQFADESFDAVTAFYSLTHVPRSEHEGVFRKIVRWLRPGGLFLATLSSGDSPDWTGEWLGQEMFFSGHDPQTSLRLLAEAGLEIVHNEQVEIQEPEGPARFLWVLAQRKAT